MTVRQAITVLATGLLLAAPLGATPKEPSETRLGEIGIAVARMLESAHFSRTRLNDEIAPGVTQARRALDTYLEALDYNRLFLTRQDIDEFTTRHGDTLQDDLLLGNLQPAWDIYDRLLQRVESRVEKISKLLDENFTFDSDRTTQLNRDKSPWPADEAEADRLWRDRLEAELLQAVLAERALENSAARSQDADPETNAGSASDPQANDHESITVEAVEVPREFDVDAYLNRLRAKSQGDLDWTNSVVNLMKLVGMDSRLKARRKLANELGYDGNMQSSAAMNQWLHGQIRQQIAQQGLDNTIDRTEYTFQPGSPVTRPPRTPVETVRTRYERLLKTLQEETREDQVNTFLSALARSYDPHSDYMSQRALDNFNIQMSLSLVGIGAVLRSEDGYAKIVELVPGGPAARGGQLRENDRIVAVAQGDNEFEDVVDMKLDRVVERIRGKKGTTVRLQVQPANAVDPAKLEVISIVRDEVQLKDQQAKAQVIDVTGQDGDQSRIGWITLPSFYANMNQRGQPRSTTRDVSALLKRLKKENIEGLIIDLRRDSGGSLDEAIRMTGLFIPQGPVVQARDTNGKITSMNDPDPGVLWDGPLIVLMNRLSASASEIFAAALQDYGRAIVVGDEQSFGKGTVQTLLDVHGFMPLFARDREAGAVKLTIQKFYRIKGGSTQLRGVASDIVLPSLTDQPDVGEGSLKNPLGYDEVPARTFSPFGTVGTLLPGLRAASEARVSANPDFTYILEDRERFRQRVAENAVSLNKATRLAEIEEDKARREARLAERKERGTPELFAKEITLDTVNTPELKKVALDKPPKRGYEGTEDSEDPSAPDEEEPFVDPVRDEALLIMQDYIRLQGPPPVTAQAAGTDNSTP